MSRLKRLSGIANVDALPEVLEFEWNEGNEQKNWIKHDVRAEEGEEPFLTQERLAAKDKLHSTKSVFENSECWLAL